MGPKIDIDVEVHELLKANAEPFTDTPNSVLRRLLGLSPTPTTTEASPMRRGIRSRKPTARAAAGSLLPEESYELPLLTALSELGGQAPYRDVLNSVERLLDTKLTPLDKDTLKSGGVRWHTRLQFVRLRLIERGLLDRNTPRGLWGITDTGRAAVKEGRTR